MKKLYITLGLFICLLGGLLSSCNSKEDPLLCESALERVDKVASEYFDLLVSSPQGWMLTYETKAGPVFHIIMKFNEDGTVLMRSDVAKGEEKSSWRISGEESALLSFSTYNLLHLLADPGISPAGKGFEGEFEFIFDHFTENEICTLGRKYHESHVFSKATEEDWQEMIDAEKIITNRELLFGSEAPLFRVLVDANEEAVGTFIFDGKNKTIDFYYEKDGKPVRFDAIPIIVTMTGFELSEENQIDFNGVTLSSFTFEDESGKVVKVDDADLSIRSDQSPTEHPLGAAMFYTSKTETHIIYNFSDVAYEYFNNFFMEVEGGVQGFTFEYLENEGLKFPIFNIIIGKGDSQRLHYWLYHPFKHLPAEAVRGGKLFFATLGGGFLPKEPAFEKEHAAILEMESFKSIIKFLENENGVQVIPDNEGGFYFVNPDNSAEWIRMT